MTPRRTTKRPSRAYSKSGINTLKQAVKTLGSRALDKRTMVARTLAQWRSELMRDLGGSEAVSTQETAIVDLAVKTKLILDSVDNWLLTQPSLINLRKRALLPVVTQRQQLADSLARYMTSLGLERKAKPVPALSEYLDANYKAGHGKKSV